MGFSIGESDNPTEMGQYHVDHVEPMGQRSLVEPYVLLVPKYPQITNP